MMYPRIDDLLKNVRESRYALVIAAAKRARQINNYHHQLGEGTFDDFPPPLVESRSKNYLTMSLEEVAQGKIGYEYLGVSVYELAPGQSMVFHYHLQNEEVLIALRGRLMLRTFDGERELENVSVYHETNEIGIFDAARPADRRFGGLFRLNDAVSDYGGAKPKI